MMPRPFPNFGYWNAWADQIDNGELMDFINRELGRCGIYLSDADIRKFLGELKDAARLEEYDFGGDRGDELVTRMRGNLTKDLESNGGQGLYRSRSRFLVFCYVARRTNSDELAGALLRFFSKKGTDIVDEEKSFLLTEWCLGLQQLEGLVPEDKLHKAFRQVASLGPPMFEEWRRPGPHHSWVADILRLFHERVPHDHSQGRSQLQLIAPGDFPVRRLSVPPFSRPSFIDLPPYPRTGYNSPLISPRHDLHALHLQQHMQAFELARLQRDVDDLRHRC
ncbi:hypothetical protein BU25DRAFT_214778 [Macroventuria anomochaeta]|uniref:Uncharacterized protein n=1 Tax=Macroventuria anomochaeta TaxID=301207 RepID=A0ACB6RMD6_9PLEO|nr:uncharacterized protein BU25DRAFT_214778 [Macroventuria anomochaeta]KAF2622319.1 hypothetical protein BU25DRAFT_214778 [Macroventuria anomochaeta]